MKNRVVWPGPKITQITQLPMFWKWGACKAISLGYTEEPVATVKAKQKENGGPGDCPKETF